MQGADQWIDKCIAEVTSKSPQPMVMNGIVCSPSLRELTKCVWRERSQNCPAEKQVTTGICALTRNFMGRNILG
jgi:hypothetical protein